MSSNLKANCHGFASGCRKLHFSSVGCCKPKMVGKHCLTVSKHTFCVRSVNYKNQYGVRLGSWAPWEALGSPGKPWEALGSPGKPWEARILSVRWKVGPSLRESLRWNDLRNKIL